MELTEADLSAYQVAAQRYAFLKQGIVEKQAKISQKTEELRTASAEAKTQIEAAIANEGLDIKASDILKVEVNIPLEPVSSIDKALSEQSYPYDQWANQTIQELQYLIGNEQRAQFLEKALVWSLQTEHLLAMIQTRASLSKEELNAFEAASNKVKGYIFGGINGQPGVLTEDFWFRDLGLDASVRDAIDGPLAARNPEAARRLKADINGLKALSESIVTHLKAISEFSLMYKAAQNEAEKSFIDKLIAGATAVIEQAPAIAECLAKSYAVGPYADFYALYYEADFCTGQPNDEIDQLISGVSLSIQAGSVLFSGPIGSWIVEQAEQPIKFLKKSVAVMSGAAKAKTLEKLEKVGALFSPRIFAKTLQSEQEAAQLARGVFNSAKTLGLNTAEEIKDLTKIADEAANGTGEGAKVIDNWAEAKRLGAGPQLPPNQVANFTSGKYFNRKLSTDEIYFRYHGVDNRSGRKFIYTMKKEYADEASLREGVAILNEWGVTMTSKSKVRVPAGQWVSEGRAASQTGALTGEIRKGGDYQALFSMPDIPDSWIVTTGRAFP